MEKIIDKQFLDAYINTLIQRCSFLYGIDYTDILRKRLNNINSVVVSDEISNDTSMYYDVSKNNIYINAKYVGKDYRGNYIVDFDKSSDFFKHSLIHELLHVASNYKTNNGIITPSNASYLRLLNEGITQMMADDICGYYENKFLCSYNEEKIIARILRNCLGQSAIVDSYFVDSNIIKDKIFQLTLDSLYFAKINAMITNHFKSKDYTKEGRMDLILKSIVINIVIPTYNSLSDSRKEAFLSKLLYDISGDEVIKNKVLNLINQNISITREEKKEKNRIINETYNQYEAESDLMGDLSKLNRYLIMDNGEIYSLDKKNKITKREDKEKIYVKLFELNGYKKYLNNDIVKKYISCILRGEPLRIRYDSILKRRILFCGIKECLLDNGYYILNDYEELDKSDTIKVEYINKRVSYEDYKKMCKNFSLCKTRVSKNSYSYSIVYNSTKNELEDVALKKMAFYAINWMNTIKDGRESDFNEAFNPAYRRLFYHLISVLCVVNERMDNFDLKTIEKFYKENSDFLRRFLKTPMQVEWVYDYIKFISNAGPIKERKGLSHDEIVYKNYLMDKSSEEAKEIVRKI